MAHVNRRGVAATIVVLTAVALGLAMSTQPKARLPRGSFSTEASAPSSNERHVAFWSLKREGDHISVETDGAALLYETTDDQIAFRGRMDLPQGGSIAGIVESDLVAITASDSVSATAGVRIVRMGFAGNQPFERFAEEMPGYSSVRPFVRDGVLVRTLANPSQTTMIIELRTILAESAPIAATMNFIDVYDATILDDKLYVIDGPAAGISSTLTIVDVANPTQPATVGTTEVPHAGRLTADGDRVYIASRDRITAVDITNATQPELVPGEVAIPGIISVAAANDVLYVVTASNSSVSGRRGLTDIVVVDVRSATLSSSGTAYAGEGRYDGVLAFGQDELLICSAARGLLRAEMDSTNMTVAVVEQSPSIRQWFADTVEIDSGDLVTYDSFRGLRRFSVDVSGSISETGSLSTLRDESVAFAKMIDVGDVIYIATSTWIAAVQVSSGTPDPVLLELLEWKCTRPDRLRVHGDRLLVLCREQGIAALDVTQPESMTLDGWLSVGVPVTSFVINEQTLVVADTGGWVRTYDLSAGIGSFVSQAPSGDGDSMGEIRLASMPAGMVVVNGFVVAVDGSAMITSIFIGSPASPEIKWSGYLRPRAEGFVTDAIAHDNIVIVATKGGGSLLIDVTNPLGPLLEAAGGVPEDIPVVSGAAQGLAIGSFGNSVGILESTPAGYLWRVVIRGPG